MIKKHRDIESIVDTLGINLNPHQSFGNTKISSQLTSVCVHQASPEETVDTIEKKT